MKIPYSESEEFSTSDSLLKIRNNVSGGKVALQLHSSVIIFSVLFKALQDLKQLDFNDFNFGQAPSTMTDSANIIQNLLDSRFYDDDNNGDYLSYF